VDATPVEAVRRDDGACAVLGPGGVGGALAVRTGAVCVASERTAAAIAAHGLRLEAPDGVTCARPRVLTALAEPVDLLVVAVKAPALAAAMARIDARALGRGTVVLPLLNGLEHVASLRAWAGPDGPTVAAGSIGRFEASSPEPGVVVQRSPGALVRAACDELESEQLERALAALRAPGVEVTLGRSEAEVLWEKAARLAVLAAATSAWGRPVGALREDAGARADLRAGLAEACAAAAAAGVALDPDAQWAIVQALPADLTTSTARDVAAGAPDELDAITGSVVRAARRAGVDVPTLERLLTRAEARRR
jgi:2-dehydropantoate 2-reductase